MLQEIRPTKAMLQEADQSFFDLRKNGVLTKVNEDEPSDFIRARLIARLVFKNIYPGFHETDHPFVFWTPCRSEKVDVRAIISRRRPNETYHVMVKTNTGARPRTYYFFFVSADFQALWIAGWKPASEITNRHARQGGERSRARPGFTYAWPCWEFRVSELVRSYRQEQTEAV